VKRYGLPIGTPLGKGNKAVAQDASVAKAYDTFMAANTPADLNKAASWMSNDDLAKASKGLFSFDSKNERDQAGRIALVKELAARGIDPHQYGYKGGQVVLNPNPKPDPVAKAAQKVQKTAQQAQKAADTAAKQAQAQAVRDQRTAAQSAKVDAQTKASQALADNRKKLGDAIAQGLITDAEARRKLAGKT
jgi:hypothetical protein